MRGNEAAKRATWNQIGNTSTVGILSGNRKEGQSVAFSDNNGFITIGWRENQRSPAMRAGTGFLSASSGRRNKKQMENAVNLLMLLCATLASLAFGVLVAYGTCRVTFRVLRGHAGHVAERARSKAQAAPVSHA